MTAAPLPVRAGAMDDSRAAVIALKRGQYLLAAGMFTRAIESGRLSNKQLATAYVGRGICLHRLEEYALAVVDYDQAIRLEPKYARAYYQRGRAFKLMGRLERAVEDFSTAIRLNRKLYMAYLHRAVVYYKLGKKDEFRADWKTFKELTGR